MEIEFHYFITKALALRAGLKDEESEIIAYSSQFTDDNVRQYRVNDEKNNEFKNYISFTYDILKPRKSLIHIYPIFHFIPGVPNAISAQRIDKRKSIFNTIPDSINARKILKKAFDYENLYRIGIALHGFADTFAHQNFIGLFDRFNAIKGISEIFTPNVGHADAGNKPDYVSLHWNDPRLKKEYQYVDNNQRFLDAASRIFEELCLFKGKTYAWIEKQWRGLKVDLIESFGKPDQLQRLKHSRINNYKIILGVDNKYKKDLWFTETINIDISGEYSFKREYKKSNWFLFQQAVINHQNDAYKILEPLFEKTGQMNSWA